MSVLQPAFTRPVVLAAAGNADACSELRVTGSVSARAVLVVGGETATATTQAIAADAIQSFRLRVQVLTETLDGTTSGVCLFLCVRVLRCKWRMVLQR